MSKSRALSFFFAAPRTHAAVFGCGPTPGSCFPGQAGGPRLRRAIRAAAPSKSRTVSISSPRLARTRLVPGASYTYIYSGRGEILPPVPCGREETRRAKAPAHPQRTETPRKAELCSFGFSGVSLSAGGLRPNGRLSRPAARGKGEIGRRAQEWGSKGQRSRLPARSALIRVPPAHRAPRESLSTFFSEESRGPSRPERQMKRKLRGKSQTEKGER